MSDALLKIQRKFLSGNNVLVESAHITGDEFNRLMIEMSKRDEEITRLRKQLKRARELLEAAECPAHCYNGVIPEQIAEDEWQPVQCQFCYEREALKKQEVGNE